MKNEIRKKREGGKKMCGDSSVLKEVCFFITFFSIGFTAGKLLSALTELIKKRMERDNA